MNKKEIFVSVVVPVKDNANIIEDFIKSLHRVLHDSFSDYEIIVVDRGSRDNIEEIMDNILKKTPSIRFISLSESLPSEVACSCGLENTIGDIVVLMCPNYDPVNIVCETINKALEGNDVIIGASNSRKSLPYRFSSNIFRLLLSRLINYNIPKDATQFRVLSRRALNAALARNKHLHHLFVDISRVGYQKATFSYKQVARNQSRKSFLAGARKALSVLVFNSTAPLRLMNIIGILASFFGLISSAYAIAVKVFNDNVVEGWTSLSLFISVQFTLLFVILFFYGEYMARLVDEQHESEGYNVAYEKNSSVMLNEERWNVMNNSAENEKTSIQTGRDR